MKSDDELFFANGRAFHLAGTKIFEEPDGGLTFDCPHCGRRIVRRELEDALRQYAVKAYGRG